LQSNISRLTSESIILCTTNNIFNQIVNRADQLIH
jgi:hypothetical protein